jgi:hypothetical protein
MSSIQNKLAWTKSTEFTGSLIKVSIDGCSFYAYVFPRQYAEKAFHFLIQRGKIKKKEIFL